MKPITHTGQNDFLSHMESLSVLSQKMRQELEVSLQIEKRKTEALNHKMIEIQAQAELMIDKTRMDNSSLTQRTAQMESDLKKWKEAYKALEQQVLTKSKDLDNAQRQTEHFKNTWETFQSNHESSERELKKAQADLERLRAENREIHRELTQEKRNAANALQISTESARDMKVALERLHSIIEKTTGSSLSGINTQGSQIQAMVQAMNALGKSLDRMSTDSGSNQNRVLQLMQNNELNIARMRNDLELAIARMSDQLMKNVQQIKVADATAEIAKLKESIVKEQDIKREIKNAIEKAIPAAVSPVLAAAEEATLKAEAVSQENVAIKKHSSKAESELNKAREEYRVLQRSSLLELERYKDRAERSEGTGTIILEDLPRD
ncbi:MAG: hypothetical protein KA715_03165 [Xanthomonadaceae bacterium]|nr:hypothetical protein [Xanthomonadaceae bacterium]